VPRYIYSLFVNDPINTTTYYSSGFIVILVKYGKLVEIYLCNTNLVVNKWLYNLRLV